MGSFVLLSPLSPLAGRGVGGESVKGVKGVSPSRFAPLTAKTANSAKSANSANSASPSRLADLAKNFKDFKILNGTRLRILSGLPLTADPSPRKRGEGSRTTRRSTYGRRLPSSTTAFAGYTVCEEILR